MANTNADVIRPEFANDAAVIAGIKAGQTGYSLTSPYNEIHKEKGGTSRSYASNAGDREITGQVMITKTTEQLRLRYNSSYYASFTVNANGDLALSTSSGLITSTARIAITRTTEQLRLAYSAAKYATLTVDSNGDLFIGPAGTDLCLDQDAFLVWGSPASAKVAFGGTAAGVLTVQTLSTINLQPGGASGKGINFTGNDYAGNPFNHASSGHTKYLTIDENGNVLVGAQAT